MAPQRQMLPLLFTLSLLVLGAAEVTTGGGDNDVCELLYTQTEAGHEDLSDVAELFKAHVFVSHLPKLKKDAGVYTKIANIPSWPECVTSCCDDDTCDVTLFTLGICFHIRCAREPADACAPVASDNAKHNSTVMVVTRDISPSLSSTDPALPGVNAPSIQPPTHVPSNVPSGVPSKIPTSNVPTSNVPTSNVPTSNVPTSNVPSNVPSNIPTSNVPSNVPKNVPSNNQTDASPAKVQSGAACAYGLFQCTANAHCVKRRGSKSRQGHCACVEGFAEADSGECEVAEEEGEDVSSEFGASPGVKVTPSPIDTSKADHTVTRLSVTAGTNRTITLPDDSVILTALVLPEEDEGETFSYEWMPVEIPENAETAVMDGRNTKSLKLSNLIAGLYLLKVKVKGDEKFGEATINVTVLPAKRDNKKPVAIINPKAQTVVLPNSAILDGSDSTDDDKILSWKWEEVSGPLQDSDLNTDSPMLTLKDMSPGNYTFKLTVTDSDGSTNFTSANVTIQKEKDYPPQADAGSDVVIYLPQDSLMLLGNRSTDDKSSLTYEWIKSTADDLPAGMAGVDTPFLKLTNLQVGDYEFTLRVTDDGGQVDTANVHVFVKPQSNHPPTAATAGHISQMLPAETLTLDGSNSTDDKAGMEFVWTQSGGPTTLVINNNDNVIAVATGTFIAGQYEFQLTVTDAEKQTSTETLTVDFKKNENLPPKASAGGDLVLYVPVSLVSLDGGGSSDDHGIVQYSWSRDSKSLAAGVVVNKSDHSAVLQIVNMVAGQYLFTLTVEDGMGLSDTDTATVVIKKNKHQKDFVELILDASIEHFTLANKDSLGDQLVLLLQRSSEDRDTEVDFVSIQEDPGTGHLCLAFQVVQKDGEAISVMPGLQALATLQSKIQGSRILDYSMIRLDLLVCQNNCSGHGYCEQKSKRCVCEAFWMPNVFDSYFFSDQSNCDWSILYVVIVCFIITVTFVSSVWAVVCCCSSKRSEDNHRCKLKVKGKGRRHRYSLLKDADGNRDDNSMSMSGKIQNSSVMISESDLSSDEETLFISSRKNYNNGVNGKASNGTKARNKLKT